MKTLNLIDLEKSDIKYKISKFPDGQQNIVIDNSPDIDGDKLPGYYYLAGRSRIYTKESITIKSRLNNWLDLELISCSIACLKELGVKEIHLYVPYIVGARSDRKFTEGSNNYLRDVICPILTSMQFETITCLDAHSYCLEMGLKNLKVISNENLVKWATLDLYDAIEEKGPNSNYPCILVSPDAGASHKIYKLAKQIGYKGDIITCSKERDTDGKLTKTVVPITDSIIKSKKDYIIIDDICDGGATFINIAKEIKSTFSIYSKTEKPKIYLIVTHGIFSKGFDELSKYFDGIYCTNSYKDVPKYYTSIISGEQYPVNKITNELINQLNVF